MTHVLVCGCPQHYDGTGHEVKRIVLPLRADMFRKWLDGYRCKKVISAPEITDPDKIQVCDQAIMVLGIEES